LLIIYFYSLPTLDTSYQNLGSYYDEDISGTSLKKQDGFNKLISNILKIKNPYSL